MSRHAQRAWVFALACLGLLIFSTGCRTAGYYGQAAHGQFQILFQRQPIKKLVADPATPVELKQKLELILELRAFAERELALPADGHYLSYVDLRRRFVVWNVNAAPEFSLEANSWWYPIVGSLTYRGYFSEEAARRYAEKLRRRGYDVYVDGVEAYSTLGWFRDPVLNTFIHHHPTELAAIIFHELAHQRLFVSGDTDFNEAFATAVEQEAVRRWLRSRNDAPGLAAYETTLQREAQFVQLVTRTRRQLETLFGPGAKRAAPDDESRLREQKERVIAQLRADYAQLKTRWGGYDGYDGWFAQPLNNAQLNTVDTYHRLVPAFERLLADRQGDLAAFFADVKTLGQLREPDRLRRLEALLSR
ncbi:MAG: aminopeptidase [Verrucomicrobiota bacterium]